MGSDAPSSRRVRGPWVGSNFERREGALPTPAAGGSNNLGQLRWVRGLRGSLHRETSVPGRGEPMRVLSWVLTGMTQTAP